MIICITHRSQGNTLFFPSSKDFLYSFILYQHIGEDVHMVASGQMSHLHCHTLTCIYDGIMVFPAVSNMQPPTQYLYGSDLPMRFMIFLKMPYYDLVKLVINFLCDPQKFYIIHPQAQVHSSMGNVPIVCSHELVWKLLAVITGFCFITALLPISTDPVVME